MHGAGRRINAVRDVICDGCGLPVVAAAAEVATAAGDDECSRRRSTLHKIACVRQPVEPADLFLPPILASEPDTVVGADRCCLSARRCLCLCIATAIAIAETRSGMRLFRGQQNGLA